MPALNFKPRFAQLVETGHKRQTIRAEGRRVYRVGQYAHLFTGMRTKACRKIGVGRITAVRRVRLDLSRVFLDEEWLHGAELEHFVRSDGFATVREFWDFFEREYPDEDSFHGYVISWELL